MEEPGAFRGETSGGEPLAADAVSLSFAGSDFVNGNAAASATGRPHHSEDRPKGDAQTGWDPSEKVRKLPIAAQLMNR